MAFKLKPPFNKFPTPIVNVEFEEEDVIGRADKRGNILINKNITDPDLITETINHENVHIGQMARGDLDYDKDAMYWKGKKYLRSSFNEGDKTLPWEAPAYKAE
jgi:hypothetical protein